MVDPNWCFENPIEAAQEIVRLQDVCKKSIEVAEDLLDDAARNYTATEVQSIQDKMEKIYHAL